MLHNWFILLPEFAFICFLLAAVVVRRCRQNQTSKTFFTIGKIFLLVILLATIVFYNLSAFPQWFINSPYTTLFKTVMYIIALAWFYLSSKWFLNKNHPSYWFYQLGFGELLCLELLISAQNFAVIGILLPLICLINWKMLYLHLDEVSVKETGRAYAVQALLFCLLLECGVFLLYLESGSLDFEDTARIFSENPRQLWKIAVAGMLLAPVLFMLALAPFHSSFIRIIKIAVLPVSGYLTLIPPLAFLAVLMKFVGVLFVEMSDFISPILLAFAVCSIVIGALSANDEKNIRELFAFSTVYHMGFFVFSLTGGEHNNALSAFSYMQIYILAMAGIYTVFLGMKSRGNYLSDINSLNGFSEHKPYMSAALGIFMLSLVGTPPMLGFLGRLSTINNMVLDERWGTVVFMLLSLLFLLNAYLKVIRMLYFESPQTSFDRTDKAIYICLFINIILVVISILNPGYLLNNAEQILVGSR